MPDREELNREIRANYDAFKSQLTTLIDSDRGKFCLLRHGDIIEKFDTAGDAQKTGARLYQDGLYSIQEVKAKPVDLGYYSRAMPS